MSEEQKTTDFPKAYDPKQWEEAILKKWEEADLSRPETCIKEGVTKKDAELFSIPMAPPNVTGVLHLGHALENSLMDAMARYKRMCGYRTLFLVGTDHAAIATESKVEKQLREKEGKSRHDLGREEFLKRVQQFALDSHDTIANQIKRLGSSVDWSREAYTFDEKRNLAVRTVFKRMYDAGLIYRGKRIVNWDPVGQTTISDDEVVYREETAKLYYLKYGPFEIATARPETKFGDKYVVMHPDDARYAKYQHGDKLTVEWINGEIEATIIKDEVIDPAFGTGVMTITPWHSITDFELAEKHGLSMEQIIDLNGKLLPIAGEELTSIPIDEAREKIITKLQAKGLVTKIEDNYVHKVATAERTGAVIEPQVMRQWFIGVNREFERDGKMVTLKKLMQRAVREKKITILPERFEKNYFYWIDNLRDWCISRQIWFGHRIPVWYRGNEIYCDINPPEGDGWEQDPDTLDTWFSSGLWTFSTLGWPDEQSTDLKTYHPVSWIQMGYEILFFWMARMILMTTYNLNTVPFHNVYIHGMLRDKEGRKFSKSLGNGVDPLLVGKEYGTDALRLSLLSDITPGNDARFSLDKVESARNFVNKLWNIGRYVALVNPEGTNVPNSPADDWILSHLDITLRSVHQLLEKQHFSLAISTLHDFTWNDFADWYVEIHKIEKNHAVLHRAFDTLLRAWHPFMPFVTEALFQQFNPDAKIPLMGQSYPTESWIKGDEYQLVNANTFETVIALIQKIRNVRATYHIDPKETLTLTLIAHEELLTPLVPIIQRLGRIDDVLLTDEAAQPAASASIVVGSLHGFIHLGDVIDIDQEKARLSQEKEKLSQSIMSFETRLADQRFRSKAPAEIIAAQERTLTENRSKLTTLTESIAALG